MKSVLAGLRRLPEFIRWRNPFLLLLLLTREILRPFVYWYAFDIFQRDPQQPMPPYSKQMLELRIYEGTADLQKRLDDLAGLDGLGHAEIKMRFERGDVVAVVYAANEAVGCMWLTFSSGMELAFGTKWRIGPAEALRYGAFVRPEWRGRAVHSLVNDAIIQYARKRGIVCVLAGISALNSQSMNLPKHLRASRVMRVFLFHVRGLNWTYQKAIGAPFESRFTNAPASGVQALRPQSSGLGLRPKVRNYLAHLLCFQNHLRRQSRTRL